MNQNDERDKAGNGRRSELVSLVYLVYSVCFVVRTDTPTRGTEETRKTG